MPLFIADLDSGRAIFASPPCAELFGIPLPELLAGTTHRIYADAERAAGHHRAGQARGRPQRLRGAPAPGRRPEFRGAFTSRRIMFQGEQAMVTAVVDLTARRAAPGRARAPARGAAPEREADRARRAARRASRTSSTTRCRSWSGYADPARGAGATPRRATRARRSTPPPSAARGSCAPSSPWRAQRPPQRGPVPLDEVVMGALDLAGYGLRSADIEVSSSSPPDLPPVMATPTSCTRWW